MKKLKTISLVMLMAIPTFFACKKSSTNTTSNSSPSAPATPTLDTTVNVDLVIVASSSGGTPNSLTVYTHVANQNTNSSTYNSQTLYYPNWNAVWYSGSTPPVITTPCTQSALPLVMKFSRTAKTEISISVDVSVRFGIYDPSTHSIANTAGTFQLDRTCKPGKWVILCSK